MYSRRDSLILAFHGCDKKIIEEIIHNKKELSPSKNDYDWLGHGIYFWENDPERALEWAKESCQRKGNGVPGVIGAVLSLGNCLDFTSRKSIEVLKKFCKKLQDLGFDFNSLPSNTGVKKKRDCTIIEALKYVQEKKEIKYDSVRSAFIEGDSIFPGSTFRDKNHVQIAIINPVCIKAYFIPKGY